MQLRINGLANPQHAGGHPLSIFPCEAGEAKTFYLKMNLGPEVVELWSVPGKLSSSRRVTTVRFKVNARYVLRQGDYYRYLAEWHQRLQRDHCNLEMGGTACSLLCTSCSGLHNAAFVGCNARMFIAFVPKCPRIPH